ncbi:MAG: FHA domain-containing protein [Myxococcota bacterium]
MRVVLEVEKGPNKGARYEIGLRAYRAIGRGGQVGEITMDLGVPPGERSLDAEDIARVEEHLARRRAGTEPPGERLRIGSFLRERDILLDDDKVSRTHAMLFLDEVGPSLVDLLSTNGTLVNGNKIADTDLADGDIIHIGKTRFIVSLSPA